MCIYIFIYIHIYIYTYIYIHTYNIYIYIYIHRERIHQTPKTISPQDGPIDSSIEIVPKLVKGAQTPGRQPGTARMLGTQRSGIWEAMVKGELVQLNSLYTFNFFNHLYTLFDCTILFYYLCTVSDCIVLLIYCIILVLPCTT